jgi:hypothetical protein
MKDNVRGSKQLVSCKNCKTEFLARIVDIKRGWGKFCSKSCKAIKQEARTGQMRNYLINSSYEKEYHPLYGYGEDESCGELCSSSCNSE